MSAPARPPEGRRSPSRGEDVAQRQEGSRTSFIQVRKVWQQYGDQTVLENLRLDIAEGEFCALVALIRGE